MDTTLWQCSKIFRNREGSDFEFKVNCPELHISWCWIIFEASHAFPHTFGADHNIFQAEETLVATYSTSDMDDHVCTKRDVSSDTSPHRSKIPRIHSGKFPPKLLVEQRSNFREVFLSQWHDMTSQCQGSIRKTLLMILGKLATSGPKWSLCKGPILPKSLYIMHVQEFY